MSTPAIKALGKLNAAFTLHEYEHDPTSGSYGEEAATKMGVDPERVFKTLVAVSSDDKLVVAIVPVTTSLDVKKLATVLSAKKTKMANPDDVERITGYVLGGVSPLGQKKPLQTYLDTTAQSLATIFVSAGKRGLEIELAPAVLCSATDASYADISSDPTPQ